MPTSLERVSRVAISEEAETLRISINPRWYWGYLFTVVWLYFWTATGISRGRSHFHHLGDFLSSWMLGWAFGEIMGLCFLLRAIGGREIIVVRADSLSRKSEIFRFGFTRTYFASEMRNLRFRVAGGRRQPSRLAFDYEGRTVTFASYLDDEETVYLLRRIRQKCAMADGKKPEESSVKLSG